MASQFPSFFPPCNVDALVQPNILITQSLCLCVGLVYEIFTGRKSRLLRQGAEIHVTLSGYSNVYPSLMNVYFVTPSLLGLGSGVAKHSSAKIASRLSSVSTLTSMNNHFLRGTITGKSFFLYGFWNL